MEATSVTTGKTRLAFPKLWKPEVVGTDGNGRAKYAATFLIPKSDTETINKINAAVQAAINASGQTLTDRSGQLAANLKFPLTDGDMKAGDYPEYAGHWYINAYSDRKPAVFDQQMQPLSEDSPNNVYSGCYVRGNVNFYAYNSQSKGIACGLSGLQKWEDGENLGGGGNFDPNEAFGVISDYQPMAGQGFENQTPPPAQQYQQQPPMQQPPAQQYQQQPPAQQQYQQQPPMQQPPGQQYPPSQPPAQQQQPPAQQYPPPAQGVPMSHQYMATQPPAQQPPMQQPQGEQMPPWITNPNQ